MAEQRGVAEGAYDVVAKPRGGEGTYDVVAKPPAEGQYDVVVKPKKSV